VPFSYFRQSLDTFADMPQARRMYFYEKAMEDVEHGVVVCRTMRFVATTSTVEQLFGSGGNSPVETSLIC